MAFNAFRDLGAIIQDLKIIYQEGDFLEPVPFVLSEYFREDLRLTLADGLVENSEVAICENLVYPVLKEVWKAYRSHFLIWSQQFLHSTESFDAFPEYIIASRSPLGKVVFDQPYLIVVEAKQDNFNSGWCQCLLEMMVADRINGGEPFTVFGVVTNGELWQFGKLEKQQFTRQRYFYRLQNLDELSAVLNFIFQSCENQLKSQQPVSV